MALLPLASCLGKLPPADAGAELEVGAPLDIELSSAPDSREVVNGFEIIDATELVDAFEAVAIPDLAAEVFELAPEPKDLVTEHQYQPPVPDIVPELPGVEVVELPDVPCAGECKVDNILCSANKVGYWSCLVGPSGCNEWLEPQKCPPGLSCSCRDSRSCVPEDAPCICLPECTDKECGDNSCNGICGICAAQHLCIEGLCVCQPDCVGKVCGDDGCGGSCGTCPGPQDACLSGKCVCQPLCEGKECGHDGCGGQCGTCTGNTFCNPDQFCEWVMDVCEDGWCLIPAGTFFMGPSETEPCAGSFEKRRPVAITRSFLMRQYEITQTDWLEVLGNVGNPSSHPGCGGDCPVETISWIAAAKFCNAWSELEGYPPCYLITEQGGEVTVTWPAGPHCEGYRLPTDAEWEYAYRAGRESAFYSGEVTSCNGNDPALGPIAWYKSNSGSQTHFYGYKNANGWGLWDMSGNVTEWVWDWYEIGIPVDFSLDPTGPEFGDKRVVRNCAFTDYPKHCRASYRQPAEPDSTKNSRGLRVVRTVGP